MSDEDSSSANESHIVMSSSSARDTTCAARPGLASDWILMPNAAARSATARPIEPRPMMPIVDPSRPPALL